MHEYGFFLIYGCKEQFEKKLSRGNVFLKRDLSYTSYITVEICLYPCLNQFSVSCGYFNEVST